MRLVTFDDFTPGLLQGEQVFDLTPALGGIASLAWDEVMPAIIADFDRLKGDFQSLAQSGQGRPLRSVRLRAPIPRPSKIPCAIANYNEYGLREPPQLDFFFKSPESVIGPGDTVVLPKLPATVFHHEAELAVVIGKEAFKVSADKAMDYVFGYTALIDVSARDVGRPVVGTFLGKSFDTFAPMGPCLVTADEIPDPHHLQVKLSVSGELRQDFATDDMVNRIPKLIEFTSAIFTLNPGDVIATGTNHHGLGALQDGDEVVMEIQEIGSFTVSVKDPLKRSWTRGIDQTIAERLKESGRLVS